MAETKKTSSKRKLRSKSKKRKFVPHGNAYIQATYNNTLVTVTDPQGNILAWSSAGHMGFKGPKKATPFAATTIVREISEKVKEMREISEKVKEMGIKSIDVFVKGVGSGREASIRAFNANNITVLSIKDVTPIPHNGCRPPKPRRV